MTMASAFRTRCGLPVARFVAAMGLATAALGVGAELLDIVWDSAGRFDKALSVPPGSLIEVCGKLGKGQAVAWNYKAAQPVDFNIHYHQGKEVHFPTRQDQSLGAQGVLDTSVDQDYCWMWTNKSQAAVELSLSLLRR